MEIFSSTLLQQVQMRKYGFHPRCKLTKLTHLCFADDLLVFFKGSCDASSSLKTSLHFFSLCSGLQINRQKTSLFHSAVYGDTLYNILQILDCTVGELPVRYLGVPLLSTRLSYKDCIPLINKIRARIHSWKSKYLAYPGRLLLIKVVLSGMVFFWLSCFILPKKSY